MILAVAKVTAATKAPTKAVLLLTTEVTPMVTARVAPDHTLPEERLAAPTPAAANILLMVMAVIMGVTQKVSAIRMTCALI